MKNILMIGILFVGMGLNAQTTKMVTTSKTEKKVDKATKSYRSLEIEKEIVDGKEKVFYKLSTEENGKKKVVEWNGEGEMPKEIAAELAKMEDEKEVELQEKHEVVIKEERNGVKTVKVWDGTGDMPKEIKERMKESEKEQERYVEEREIQTMKFMTEEKVEENINVKMGIELSHGKDGVKVEKVMPNSPASQAGMQVGDILLKMNDTYILSDDMLMEFLSHQKAGEKVKTTVLRNGKEKKLKVKLEAK